MIEISILELLYLVLTFFLVVIGTLLSLVLIRVLKILRVWTEIADYYWEVKKFLVYYAQASFVMKDKIFEYFANNSQNTEPSSDPTQK